MDFKKSKKFSKKQKFWKPKKLKKKKLIYAEKSLWNSFFFINNLFIIFSSRNNNRIQANRSRKLNKCFFQAKSILSTIWMKRLLGCTQISYSTEKSPPFQSRWWFKPNRRRLIRRNRRGTKSDRIFTCLSKVIWKWIWIAECSEAKRAKQKARSKASRQIMKKIWSLALRYD